PGGGAEGRHGAGRGGDRTNRGRDVAPSSAVPAGCLCVRGAGFGIVLCSPVDAYPPTFDRLAMPGAVVRRPCDGASEPHRARLDVAVGYAGVGQPAWKLHAWAAAAYRLHDR